jgi:hypothetical protein
VASSAAPGGTVSAGQPGAGLGHAPGGEAALGVAGFAGILLGVAAVFQVLQGLSAIGAAVNFAFLPYYPLWTILLIGLDVLVIRALCSLLGSDRAGTR